VYDDSNTALVEGSILRFHGREEKNLLTPKEQIVRTCETKASMEEEQEQDPEP